MNPIGLKSFGLVREIQESNSLIVLNAFDYLNTGINHMDVIRSISFYSTKVVLNLRLGSMSLDKLNVSFLMIISGLK